jgi:hypothetical protein
MVPPQGRTGFTIERPVRSLKIKNLQTPAKRRMKAFNKSPEKQFRRLVSSFSLTEKFG